MASTLLNIAFGYGLKVFSDWLIEKKKLKTERQNKLRDLIYYIESHLNWHSQIRDFHLNNGSDVRNNSYLPELESVTAIYFPELSKLVRKFSVYSGQVVVQYIHWKNDKEFKTKTYSKESWEKNFQALMDTKFKLIEAIEILIKQKNTPAILRFIKYWIFLLDSKVKWKWLRVIKAKIIDYEANKIN